MAPQVIHFDTNALVALPLWAHENHPAIRRIAAGEPAGASTIVWYEFLVGPLTETEHRLARAFLRGNIVPIDAADAKLAAEMYNRCGRRRTLKTDALIAASAIRAQAGLLTLNGADFEPFCEHGLYLLPP